VEYSEIQTRPIIMPIKQEQFDRLIHDLRRIEKVIEIIADESNEQKRKTIADLLRQEFDRLFSDILEEKEKL
jgi:hypothetical protein